MNKIITREKVEERLPFCFGVLQRIADDLKVTRTAVSRFLNLPENLDLKEMVKEEKKRMREYAEMTVMRNLIAGDIETAKWFLTAFPSNGLMKKPKPYRTKKSKNFGYYLFSDTVTAERYRGTAFAQLDFVDKELPGATTQYLMHRLKKDESGLVQEDLETIEKENEEFERSRQLHEKNAGKSGHEIYEEFKKNRGV
jgi:predicted transcriptional regulator